MVTTPEYRAQLSLEEWAPVLTRMQDARQAKVLALALIQSVSARAMKHPALCTQGRNLVLRRLLIWLSHRNWAGSPDQQTAAHVALWEAMATALAPRAQGQSKDVGRGGGGGAGVQRITN